MFVIYIGLDFKKLPLDIRENFVFSKSELPAANSALNSEKSILENVILSTCNRTEIYAVVDQIHTGQYYLKRFLARWFNVSLKEIENLAVIQSKRDAITHLFEVTTGLDSLNVGEVQILGQVKNAFAISEKRQTVGAIFQHLFKQAITFSKKMHTEYRMTELSMTSYQAGLHEIKAHLGTLTGKRLAVVGTGEIGRHVIENASTMGYDEIVVYNRTMASADEIASEFPSVTAREFGKLTEDIDNFDAVVAATSSRRAILELDGSYSRLQVAVDLGVPRNIHINNDVDNIHGYNIDDLDGILVANSDLKHDMIEQVKQFIPQAVEEFYVWQKQLHVVPVIKQLRESSLSIEANAYDSLMRKLPDLDDHEKKVISKHMKSIINQIIKEPIKQIKELSVQDDAKVDLDFFCDIFGLPKNFLNER